MLKAFNHHKTQYNYRVSFLGEIKNLKALEVLKKIVIQLIIILFISFIFTGFDYVYLGKINNFSISPNIFIENSLVFVLFYFAFQLSGFFIFYFIAILINLVTHLHVAYFGRLLSPIEIYLFFTNFGETQDAFFNSSFKKYELPFAFFFVSLFIGIIFYYGLKRIKKLRVKYLSFILFAMLLYKPLFQYFTINFDKTHQSRVFIPYGFVPETNHSSIVTFYKDLTYLFSVYFPKHFRSKEEFKSSIINMKVKEKEPNINIIYVQGESLRPENMSLFGYPVETTPQLENLKKELGLLAFKAKSGSVSTDTSLPLFFNDTYGLNAYATVLNGGKCLFKMAKENGFQSYFFSDQPDFAIKSIEPNLCPGATKEFQVAHTENVYDIELFNYLKTINLNQGHNFIVLHQNGSHDPYQKKYPENFSIPNYSPLDLSNPNKEKIQYYDTSVAYTDYVLGKIISYLKDNSKQVPTYFIFTSDHGESLGEKGIWGHVHLLENHVYSVPFLFWSSDKNNSYYTLLKKQETQNLMTTHSTVSSLIVNLLGYDEKLDLKRSEFEVLGPSLIGDQGSLILKIN